jgi:prevent-host-death family protein
MATEIGAFEAKNKLSALLERVERGEEITITRRGRPVARLVPVQRPALDAEAARAAVARIVERSRGVTLEGLKIKDLINEGRR